MTTNTQTTFTTFLQTKLLADYHGTDDNMSEAFERALEKLQTDEWIALAEEWGKHRDNLFGTAMLLGTQD